MGVVAVALIVIGSICAIVVVRKITRTEPLHAKTSVEVVGVQPRAVAVLPFDNLSSEPGNDFIALGMADTVLHQLASVPELIVVARSSSFALGKPAPDAREAGRRLGVRYLVEGSVQRSGKVLRVTAQLIDTTTNNELWSLRVDRNVDDVFLVQDQIAQRVAQQLDVTVHGRAAAYAQYGTDAYLAFLKGRALIESRRVKDVEDSIRQFSLATGLAPTFAAAIAELARAKLLLANLHGDFNKSEGRLWPEVNALVDRAIEIDPDAGEPYFLRARYKLEIENDSGAAESDIRTGLQLAPNYGPGLHFYATYLFDRGRYDESLIAIDRARLVEPLAAENHYFKGEVIRLGLHGREEAAALYLQALAVGPDFYPAYTRLAQVRLNQGRLAEAIKYGEKSLAIEPGVSWTRDRLLWFYVDIGDLSAARDVFQGYGAGWVDRPAAEAMICYRAGRLERADSLIRENIDDPDFNADGLAFRAATDAVIERALLRHGPEAARQFILAIPGLKKEHDTLDVVAENFPAVVQLATLERVAGSQAVADNLASRILEFVDHGGNVGLAGEDEWTRATAAALLRRDEAALLHLENLIRSGNHIEWWDRIERNPAFVGVRATARFQAILTEDRGWLQTQEQLLAQMRSRGEVPSRPAAKITKNGC
jgi:TolB-like protein/Tfp pilus assembly protein PilF